MLTKTDITKLKGIFALKDDLVKFKDEILSEIIKLRDDITVVIGYRDMIENHELRITKLEKKTAN